MAGNNRLSKAREIDGHWLSNEAVTNLPRVRHAFDLNRDPYIRKQIQDNEKSESQRRQEQAGGRTEGGSGMVKRDKPVPAPHPPSSMRQSVDRQNFQGRWLAEQRDAVLARAAKPKPEANLQRDRSRASQEPSR
jgi:hypothetical protein